MKDKFHPLLYSFRWGRIAALVLITFISAYSFGALTFELDLSSALDSRVVSVGELCCYVGVLAIGSEACRLQGPWEAGWRRGYYRAVVGGAVLCVAICVSALLCGWSIVKEVGIEVRWWVPLVNALIVAALTIISSRLLPSPVFIWVPCAVVVGVLLVQTLHIPGSYYVFMAAYSPEESPGAAYWIPVAIAMLLLCLMPVDRLGRAIRNAGFALTPA